MQLKHGPGKRIIAFVMTLVTVCMTLSSAVQPGVTDVSIASSRTIDPVTTDQIAHSLGTEWHGTGPRVVDFGPVDPAAPIAGMDQWLQTKATAASAAVRPRSAVTARRKLVVIRAAFSDQTMQRFTDAELRTLWFDPINVLFDKMSNGNFGGWDVTIVPQVVLENPKSDYTVIDSADATALYNDDTNNIQDFIDDTLAVSDEPSLEPLIEAADTVVIIAANAVVGNAARIRAFNSRSREFDFPFPDLADDRNFVFIDEGGNRDSQLQWGSLAHELAHALQAYAGPSAWAISHPSNYESEFELLDANYPGHIGAYLKGVTMADWQPAGQTITISSEGKTQSDRYCLNPIELDYRTNPTPQILKINITESLYYLVSVRYEINGDELNSWDTSNRGIPDQGVLIERVITGGTQWDDVDGDGMNDSGETDSWRVIVRGPPTAGVQDKDKLWAVGQTFSNMTDGSTSNLADGVSINVVSAPSSAPMQRCVQVTFGAGSTQPDVGIRPWRQAPGETYETTDIWIDSPLNGYGTFRYGTWNDLDGNAVPRGNGDDPAIGSINRLYARVHNFGSANATNVKVQFQNTDPLGVGVNGATWVNSGLVVDSSRFPALANMPPHSYTDVYLEWTPTVTLSEEQIAAGNFDFHTCVRVTMTTVAGETITGNQDGDQEQENIRNFEATPEVSPVFTHSFDLKNDSISRSKLLHLSTDSTIPEGWKVDINNAVTDVSIPPSGVVTIPVTVTAQGTSVIGSQFTLSIGVISNTLLINNSLGTDPLDRTHPAELEVGGFDFTVNVRSPTDIACQAYGRGTRIEVNGALDGFEGIHQAGTPLRAYAQLYDTYKNPIPLDDRAKADVGANGAFVANFTTVTDQKGTSALPVYTRCLFPGTHLLGTSSTDFVPIDFGSFPPTPTAEPWLGSQFHFSGSLNQFLPPVSKYSDQVAFGAPGARQFGCLAGRCPILTNGVHGRAVEFNDSTDSFLLSNSNLSLGNVYSVSLWARRLSYNRAETLLSHGNTLLQGKLFNMGFNESGNFVCSTYGDDVVSTRRIQDTDWHQYQCDIDGSDRSLIIDGQLDTLASSALSAAYSVNSFVLIGRRADRTDSFLGVIDEVNIFQSLSSDADQLFTKPGFDIAGYTPTSHLTFDDVAITQGTNTLQCAGAACPVVTYPSSSASFRPSERIAVMQLQQNRALTVTSSAAAAAGTDSTLQFWGRFDSLTTLGPLVSQSQVNRPRVYISAPGVITYSGVSYSWPTESSGSYLNSFDWHHYAFVKAGTTLAIYIDGNRVAEGPAPMGLFPFRVASTTSLSVGFNDGGTGGELAAFELHNVALPGAVIAQRYATGIPLANVIPTATLTKSPIPTETSTPTATPVGTGTSTRTPTLALLFRTRTEVSGRATTTAIAVKNATETQAIPATQTKQAVINNTAVAGIATKWAKIDLTEQAMQRTATAGAIKALTRTPTPVRIVFTSIPKIPTITMVPSLTRTRTGTATITPNDKFTATASKTPLPSATDKPSVTPTATASLTPTAQATRTRLATWTASPSPTVPANPTEVVISATPSRTATRTVTRVPNPLGLAVVSFMELPFAIRSRALQYIVDNKLSVGADWATTYLGNDVIPYYRPDIGNTDPAYYEVSVYSDVTRLKPAGFIILTNQFAGNQAEAQVTPHDYPIAHWDSKGTAPSAYLLRSLVASNGSVKLWKLDTLSYLAVQDNRITSRIGNVPALIQGLGQQTFDTYSSGENALSELAYVPNNSSQLDDSKYTYSGAVVTTKGPQKKDIKGIWSYTDFPVEDNFDGYRTQYTDAFTPLINQLRNNASALWAVEQRQTPADGLMSIPAPASATTRVGIPIRGITSSMMRVIDPNGIFSAAPTLTTAGDFSTLNVTTRALRTGEYPTGSVKFSDGNGNSLEYVFQLIDNNTTRIVPPAGMQRSTSRAWSGWNIWAAGTSVEQRNYNQFNAGSCASGCGPTAWMMLFGWADAKSVYPPVTGQIWRRWNIYRAGGNNTGSAVSPDVGSVPGGVAHNTVYAGHEENAIRYIRNQVDTFCAGSSGATAPWDMDDARYYLSYVGTGTGLTESHNVVGYHEDRLKSYARNEIRYNGRPVVIGTGWLTHYPLAWQYRFRTRPEAWDEGWFDGDDVVYEEQFYVNSGWGGTGNGWVSASTWFAGRINP